jgi:hypothetical protein
MSEEEIKPPSRKAGPINIPSGSEIVSLLKPSPSIAVIKFAQGIIELIGRGVCLVVIFLAFLSSAIAIEQIQGLTNSNINFGATQAAAGWTIFLWLMSSIYEIFIVASRFLNFGFMMEYRKIYLIVVRALITITMGPLQTNVDTPVYGHSKREMILYIICTFDTNKSVLIRDYREVSLLRGPAVI